MALPIPADVLAAAGVFVNPAGTPTIVHDQAAWAFWPSRQHAMDALGLDDADLRAAAAVLHPSAPGSERERNEAVAWAITSSLHQVDPDAGGIFAEYRAGRGWHYFAVRKGPVEQPVERRG